MQVALRRKEHTDVKGPCYKNLPLTVDENCLISMRLKKLVYRLIVMFLSTEIFSKRRKIYTWNKEKPELL